MRCMNNRVFIGLAVAGLALFVLVPGAGRSLGPLLLAAACPLSMLFMMRGIGSHKGTDACATGTKQPGQSTDADSHELDALRARVAELETRNQQTTRAE